MRAIVVVDGAALELKDVPAPEVREGEVLVQVRATALNRADLLQRRGLYAVPPGESALLGLECAGLVERAAHGYAAGERVMALLGGGGYAELASVPAGALMRVPERLTFAQAAAIPEAYLTVWLNVFRLARLARGEALVVHAAASGIGVAALQLARGYAGVVVGTASKAKLARLAPLGATALFERESAPFAERIQAATGGRGADVILDPVGASALGDNVAALALDGRLALIGLLGGTAAELDLRQVLSKRLAILGSTLRNRTRAFKAELTADFAARALPRFASGEVTPVVDATFPLERAAEAHARMEANANVGKIVLTL